MESTKLYVDDKDIKISKSSFATYPNEHIKYEGKITKVRMADLAVILQSRNRIMDAVGYQILNAIYYLQYSTSRQITEYINTVKGIDIEQSEVSKKLLNFNRLSIVTRFSFISDEREEGTNMKFYCLDNNGKILLNTAGFSCNWQYTDSIDTVYAKSYLVRNQYILKLYKECSHIDSVSLKKLNTGIGAMYSVNNNNHILIPVRRTVNYEEELIETYKKMETNSKIMTMTNEKIIILGEDAKHIFNIFKILVSKKLMKSSTYFVTDLKLFDREFKKVFVRFGVKNTNGEVDVIMKDEILEDFS